MTIDKHQLMPLKKALEHVTPHTLRHSRVTHLMQGGFPIWAVAGSAGMSPTMVEKVYGHHSPEAQRGIADYKRNE